MWIAYFADHPHERSLHAAASLEVDTEARISVRSVIHRHYLEVLRPLVREAQLRGDLAEDADTEALMSLLLLIFPHLALAPYMRGLDPILGLDEPSPEQPALAVRRLVAVLTAAFAPVSRKTATHSAAQDLRRSRDTHWFEFARRRRAQLGQSAAQTVRRRKRPNSWNPADIDFSRDRADWEKLNHDERDFATRLCAQVIAGEEAVTEDIQPFMSAMREEGRLGDEMYLTQFAFEEAKHSAGVPAMARCRRDDRRPSELPGTAAPRTGRCSTTSCRTA